MIRQSYAFEIITPCFCGGAAPDERAEIRPASIRGQLRWWFRVLGGFQSLSSGMNLRQQENFIFGRTAGDQGNASKLMVRANGASLYSVKRKNAEDLTQGRDDSKGYLLFPLREQDERDGRKGVFHADRGIHGAFTLHLQWRGDAPLDADFRALITVLGHLGSLGFRSRRAMGALRLVHSPCSLAEALPNFSNTTGITVFAATAGSEDDSIRKLAEWLRAWRQHGQMRGSWRWKDKRNKKLGANWVPVASSQPAINRAQPGFKYARRDHNEGLDVLRYPTGSVPATSAAAASDPEQPHSDPGTTFRPALGLPIVQFFSSLGSAAGPVPRNRATVNWEYGPNGGRFASPILLRPHFDGQQWHAYVILIDVMKWPIDPRTGRPRQVHLNGNGTHATRDVSLDLYDAMKRSLETSPAWRKLH